MVNPWRLSVRVCLSHLRCFEFRRELGLSRPLGCSRNARLCWFLLGALPKFISAQGSVGEAAPGSLCQRKTHWSNLPENGLVKVAQEGALARVLLCLCLGLRTGVLLAKFLPLLFLYPLTYLAPGFSTLWLHLLFKATETSGPTYIKLGQWASTRRDLFSEAFCVQFSKLHVQVTPHPWARTEYLLQQAFGEDWHSLLFFETQEPVGSGCVAQVYKAFANISLLEKGRIWRHGELSVPGTGTVGTQRDPFMKDWRPSENLADETFIEKLLLPKADLVRSEVGVSQAPGQPPKSDHLIPVAVKVSALKTWPRLFIVNQVPTELSAPDQKLTPARVTLLSVQRWSIPSPKMLGNGSVLDFICFWIEEDLHIFDEISWDRTQV